MSSSDDDEVYNPADVAPVVSTSAGHETADVHNTVEATASAAAQPSAAVAAVPTAAAEAAGAALDDLPIDKGGLRLHALKGRVRCLTVNAAGSLLCAGGEDGQLAMWDFRVDLPTRRVQPTRVLTPFVNRVSGLQPIVSLHMAVDESYLVACQDGDSPVLVGVGGKQLGYCAMGERGLVDVTKCKGHRAPVTCSSAHAGTASQFYTSSQDGSARLWDQATFERGSQYVVKHGSGQITDTVVVESVLSLAHFPGAGCGAAFATAGEDGCVQIWDSRAKYRPGGVLGSWDIYSLPRRKPAASASAPLKGGRQPGGGSEDDDDDDVFEKHTGGMAELLLCEEGESLPVLAVRRGAVVQMLDLRKTAKPKPGAKRGGQGADGVFCDALSGLPYVLDTTRLDALRDRPGFVTSTARAGFQHVVGGHVVVYAHDAAGAGAMRPVTTWRPGNIDDDVLCAAVDGEGRLYAGLSSGDVVVQRGPGSIGDGTPVDRWLSSRPSRGGAGGRQVGEKSQREESAVDDVNIDDLF